MTITAIVTDSDKKHKYTMNDFTPIPRWAVLDPAVTSTPPAVCAAAEAVSAINRRFWQKSG